MNALALVLAEFGLLLLAAHALRWGDLGQCTLWLLLGLLPLTRRAWARIVLQAALVFGAWQWLHAASMLVQMRLALDAPWYRLGAIMGALVLLTLLTVALLEHEQVRRFFHKKPATAWPQAAAFLLTFALLAVAMQKASLPLLLGQRFFPEFPGVGHLQAGAHALYAAILAGALMDPALHRKWRPRIWALFSAVFFGQLALGLVGVEQLLMTGRLHLPVPALIIGGPLYRGGGFFMLILFGATLALLGPAWCSHLCYIGAWDDGGSRLAGRRPTQPARAPVLGRAVTLCLTVAAALGLRWAGVGWLPATLLAAGFGLGGVAVMLTLSRARGRMVHCTAWCPMGLVANLLGRCTPWRMRMARDCTRCGACSRACRYGALRPEDLDAGRPGLSCTLCGDCVSACRHGQLEYRLAGLPAGISRGVFIGLACSLHASFLAVARI